MRESPAIGVTAVTPNRAGSDVASRDGHPERHPRHITASVQQLLNAMKDVPALVQNGRLDVLSSNPLGQALFSEMFEQVAQPPNFARYVFLDPRAENFYRDWNSAAAQTVALLHAEAGRSPDSRQLSAGRAHSNGQQIMP
ncbi:MmyB family transcriptional regulator [Subtercola sp. YIM 133946]|uniref:MmyB family transcriptional regulator n=1 Tax=Subtercola sp. YIM 133946 TaxID=3118909 RepID=UPI002F946EDA